MPDIEMWSLKKSSNHGGIMFITSQKSSVNYLFIYEMFVRMPAVHCDQNISYRITFNGHQARKTFLISFIFSGLITIHSYFMTIILITMNSQHSYKHFITKTFHTVMPRISDRTLTWSFERPRLFEGRRLLEGGGALISLLLFSSNSHV